MPWAKPFFVNLKNIFLDESKPSWEKQQGAMDVESGGDVSGKEDKEKESGKKKKKKKKSESFYLNIIERAMD